MADDAAWREGLMNQFIMPGILAIAAFAMAGRCAAQTIPVPAVEAVSATVPVILDTDIGNDVDDAWALAMVLKNPRFDPKLITTTDGRRDYRARLIAKLLIAAGRTDIPIGLGAGLRKGVGKLAPWVKGFSLSEFKGAIEKDGVAALIHEVHRSKQPITVIAIGPLQTLSAALERDPSIAPKVDLVAMQGSVFRGYGGSMTPEPEYNVRLDIAGAQKVFAAPWHSAAITPLDTCGLPKITLSGERLGALQKSDDKLVLAVLQCATTYAGKPDAQSLSSSSTLFDTVAVYLADPRNRSLINLQKLRIAVTDKGMTIVSAAGAPMDVATSWEDVEAYRDFLVKILLQRP